MPPRHPIEIMMDDGVASGVATELQVDLKRGTMEQGTIRVGGKVEVVPGGSRLHFVGVSRQCFSFSLP